MHLDQAVLDGALHDRRAHLVPLAPLPALAYAFVEAGPGQRVGDGIAHVVERQAAGEIDAANQRVGGLAQVSDHEESRRFDPGGDTSLDGGPSLVGCDALLHLLQYVFVAGLDAEEDSLAAGAMHLLEQRPVDVRDPAQAFPCQWQMLFLDRLGQLERALVIECEEVVRHPDVVVTELGDLAHLSHNRFDRPCAEQVAENRLMAEITSRSEEHTSELQSLAYLVCRLLLEK